MNIEALHIAWEAVDLALATARREQNQAAQAMLQVCRELLVEVLAPGEYTKLLTSIAQDQA